MSDAIFLSAIMGPLLLVMGLSVFLYAKVWQKILNEWEKNHFSLMGIMFINLILGLVIVNKHNVWEWSPYLIVTIAGWSAMLKAAVYFLVPGDFFKNMVKALNRKSYLQSSGAVLSVLGAWLSYVVYVA